MLYVTCENCGHYVCVPEHPYRCENCGAHATWLSEWPDIDSAEDASAAVLLLKRIPRQYA